MSTPVGAPGDGAPLGASGRTMAGMAPDPCPHCGREFATSPGQPAAFAEQSARSHIESCRGPKGPAGRPTVLAPELVERIESLYRGGMGLRAIARLLAAEGVPTAHGGRWEGATVRAILLRARRPPVQLER